MITSGILWGRRIAPNKVQTKQRGNKLPGAHVADPSALAAVVYDFFWGGKGGVGEEQRQRQLHLGKECNTETDRKRER